MDNPLRPDLYRAQKPKSETAENKVIGVVSITQAFNPDSITHELGFHNVHEAIMNLRLLPKNLERPLK